jgi:hypothetical protein
MKKWTDPVKNKPAKDETLATRGDFAQFTENMRKLMTVKPPLKPVSPASTSLVTGASRVRHT